MRRTPMLCRLAVAGGATLLTLTACGGSNDTTASSTTSAAATSAGTAATSPAPDAAFCDQARTFVSEVQSAVTARSLGQADLAQQLPALVSRLQSVSPPPAIADDWRTALSSLQQLAQAFQGVNLADPRQLQQLVRTVQPVETQLEAAGQHIESYLTTQCGITAGTSAGPTT